MALAFGVSLVEGAYPDFGDHLAALDAWAARYGRSPALFSLWCSWGSDGRSPRGREFPRPETLEAIKDRGSQVLLFWEPDLPSNEQSNDRIASGEWDEYLIRWATAARDWGHTIFVRFAHEQNGNWFPWSPGKNGNTTESYKAMWRHVVRTVRAIAPKVRFIWSPNIRSSPGREWNDTWPGKRWVNYVGLSIYRWQPDSPTLDQEPVFPLLLGLGRPVIVTESGVPPAGYRSRIRWLRGCMEAAEEAGVLAYCYFDIDVRPFGQPDWRLHQKPGDISGQMRRLLSSPKYSGRVG